MKDLLKEIKVPFDVEFEGWIRFEIGMADIDYDKRYLESACARSILLFEEIFKPNDNILLLIDAPFLIEYMENFNLNDNKAKEQLLLDLTPFIANKKLINTIEFIKGNDCCYYDDDEMYLFRSIIECTVKDINYKKLLKNICGQDSYSYMEHVHFIHIDKKIKYHLYDDRGLDLHSLKKESLLDIYHKYNDWILDYNRHEIDNTFKKL